VPCSAFAHQLCKDGFVLERTTGYCVDCESEESYIHVPKFGIAFLTLVSTAFVMSVVVVCVKVGESE
jgi:hypothetical protein